MKIMTLNLHNYAEKNVFLNLEKIAELIVKEEIDIICLQEVGQYQLTEKVENNISYDNLAYLLVKILKVKFHKYYNYEIEMFKTAWDVFDEGLAILSKEKFENKKLLHLSKTTDKSNWEVRKALIVENEKQVFVSVHFGWDSQIESFEKQVKLLMDYLTTLSEKEIIISGDFNVSDQSEKFKNLLAKGYNDLLRGTKNSSNFENTYLEAEDLSQGRIDYIIANKNYQVKASYHFDKPFNRVSDHLAIVAELKKSHSKLDNNKK